MFFEFLKLRFAIEDGSGLSRSTSALSVSCDAPKGISQASRLPFALNLAKTTSAIPPDRLVHWYNNKKMPFGTGTFHTI